jgi:DNA-directed RNA polymerase subunit E'/Rpb7
MLFIISLYMILKQRLVIGNDCLDENLNRHILTKLREVSENDCSKDHGYVLKVNRLLKIVDNYISNVNSELIFIVEYDADIVKPQIHDIFEDDIFLVLRNGIFFNIKNKFKVLIPPDALTDYTFDHDNRSYVHKDNTIVLRSGMRCRVQITGVRYMNKKFDCFGIILCDN